MVYHRGLLRQRGHGIFGILLKIGGPLIGGALAPLLGDVAGGSLKKVIPGQKGKGFVNDALRTADLMKKGVRHLPGLMKTGARALLRTGVQQGS